MKYRILGLAAVGVVGNIAVAAAQPPPAPAPSAAPSAPPADSAAPAPTTTTAPPPAAPPTTQAAPDAAGATPQPTPTPSTEQTPPAATPPVMTFGPRPGADTTTPDEGTKGKEAEKNPNPFRFSWLTWHQEATSTILGVGRDNIGGEDEQYNWEFTFTPRYYFYDKERDQAYVTGKIGLETELTNSNDTTYEHEWLFQDMQVGAGYSHLFWQTRDKETKLYFGPTLNFVLPTSKASATEGKYLVTALGAGPRAQINLLGPKAKGLNNVVAYGAVTWSHLFARSYNPTFSDANYPRQDATGNTFQSDQLNDSMKSFDMDRIKFAFGYFFPIYGDLYFANAWTFQDGFKHNYDNNSACDVSIANNPCVKAQSINDPVHYGAKTTFDVSLSYDFFDTVRWAVGYANESPQIGEDGQRRNVFYSPSATFYSDIIVMLDNVLEKTKVVKLDKKTALMRAGHGSY